jgi:hypothetical protein
MAKPHLILSFGFFKHQDCETSLKFIMGVLEMTEKSWIAIKEGSKENMPSTKKVQTSGLEALKGISLNQRKRETTQIVYELNGVWKGVFKISNNQYDTLSAPGAGAVTSEGLPEVPQEGIFVAVPNGATNFEVKVIQKKMRTVPGTWQLKPAPKPITEKEYLAGKEEYLPRKDVYNSNKEFPGKDFELLGLKQLEGVPVVHLIIYLAQYKPLSKSLSVLEAMTIEVSYDVPPQKDAIPRTRSIRPMLKDLILDFDNVHGLTINNNRNASISMGTALHTLSVPDTRSESLTQGLSWYEPVNKIDLVSDLKQADIISEYVIITTPELTASVQPLLNAKSGWPHYARIATTQAISSEFPAEDLKDSIRNFLSWAWSNWQVPPHFVVLAGDVDSIPAYSYPYYMEHPISDHYYADILEDLSPEIVVSRIPTSDACKMLQICNNLSQYASFRGPDWGRWQNQVVLVAHEADTYKQCSDDIAIAIAPRFGVTKLYGDNSTQQQVIDKMNAGVLVANYRGHGNKTGWSSANGLTTAEIKALNNGSMPPMVFCICCENAWIDDQTTEVVVETFLREGKCVSVLGATRDSPTYANNQFNKYLWQSIMDFGEVTPGGIVQRAKVMMIQNYGNDQNYQDAVVLYMLCGDPTASVVSTAEFLRGTWDMDHDGWKGVLVIDLICQSQVEIIDSYGYPVWSLSGLYTDQDGKQYDMNGKIGGQDPNNLNPGCKRSDHRITFTIAFLNNNQVFTGYITTWTRNIIAGYTWWSNIPFGWYAKKR